MLKKQTGSTVIILLAVILLLLVGAGAYYLGTQNTSQTTQQTSESNIIASANPANSAMPSASIDSGIPSDWTYQKNESCKVSIPIPPKSEPYTTSSFPDGGAADDNNRYWMFQENTESSMFFFHDDASVTFYPVEFNGLGNDYNPGSVWVFCAPNPQNLTTSEVIMKLNNDIKTQGYDLKIIEKGASNKWGFDSQIINIDGGVFGDDDIYTFTGNKRMYFVNYVSNSANQAVKDTTKQIFDNLKFSN